ncbi:MAG: hypothetical protein M3384_03505 [Acidobacteriota bacterium]|nr:hypothetical protein [Acidobacteriota bacterium]
MKNTRKPTLIPLFFIIAGSCLLALPGAYGAMFLFMIALENSLDNPSSILFPMPAVIGFSLLFGYIWTAATKRFVWWLWSVSFLFNLIVSFIGFAGAAYYSMETLATAAKPGGYERLFILFPLWTTCVACASAYYFFQSRAANNCDLP